MNIACIQMAVVEGDKAATIEKAAAAVRRCRGADLVLLPEIWNVGFLSFHRYVEEAETREGKTLTAVREAAAAIGAHVHAGSFVETEGGRYFNSSYLVSPSGELLANYRKIHLFGYASREADILTPGEAVVTVETQLGIVGMATCFDLRFPELFRRMVDRGVESILVCSAWPHPRLEPWLLFNRVRALENQCFLISANAAGDNGSGRFVGNSRVVDPWGEVAAAAGEEETILRCEIDPGDVRRARDRFPALSSRVGWLG